MISKSMHVPLEDVTRIRIKCAKCDSLDSILELQIDHLNMLAQASCPTCGQIFRHQGIDNELTTLAKAMASVASKSKEYSVEITLPVTE